MAESAQRKSSNFRFFARCGLNNNSQRSELEFNIACRFCDSALDCVFRETCFKLCRQTIAAQSRRHGCH